MISENKDLAIARKLRIITTAFAIILGIAGITLIGIATVGFSQRSTVVSDTFCVKPPDTLLHLPITPNDSPHSAPTPKLDDAIDIHVEDHEIYSDTLYYLGAFFDLLRRSYDNKQLYDKSNWSVTYADSLDSLNKQMLHLLKEDSPIFRYAISDNEALQLKGYFQLWLDSFKIWNRKGHMHWQDGGNFPKSIAAKIDTAYVHYHAIRTKGK